MMAGFMSFFGGRPDPRQTARDAIVTLRQQLQMIERKEEYLQKKIEDELKKAKANAVSNKSGALIYTPSCGALIMNGLDSGDCCSTAEEGE
jgi:hypothetical protein